jgi:hypothetical protein
MISGGNLRQVYDPTMVSNLLLPLMFHSRQNSRIHQHQVHERQGRGRRSRKPHEVSCPRQPPITTVVPTKQIRFVDMLALLGGIPRTLWRKSTSFRRIEAVSSNTEFDSIEYFNKLSNLQ